MDEAWFNDWVQELRAFNRAHETQLTALRRLGSEHAAQLTALRRLGSAHETGLQAVFALLAKQDARLIYAEETLRGIKAIEDRLNNPLGNGQTT